MKSKKSTEQRITIKIGLIFLVVLLFFSGLFIYSAILKKNIDAQKEEMDNANRVLLYSNNLIVSIQHAQDILNHYMVSPRRVYRQQYDSISQDISEQIDIIKSSSPDNAQSALLEDIDSLLREKDLIVNRLLGQFRSQSPLQELDRKIETIEPVVKDTVVVTTVSDTTIVHRERRDFWSRLSHLFNPKFEPDTTINITYTEQEARAQTRVDTVMYADLKGITEEASKTYSSQMERIERQVRELVLAEQNISLNISKLTTQFYNEAIQTTQRGTENSEQLTQKIFSFAVTVGTISILLILVIIFFITDDLKKGKKARIELSREKKLTEELIESRHKLLLSVSHDVKTPLSSIMGYMEIWDSEEKKESRKKQIKSAMNSGRHILSMLTNLLEFSRLEQKSASLQKSTFNLIELINDILSMFRPFTDDKDIKLNFNNNLESPYYIETDYTILKQILVNVISNSVKYTYKGSVDIELTLQKEGVLMFTISDTGVGIDKEDLQKIFKPFARTTNPLKAEGTGFGLYVTKGLTESMQGEINISSEKGKGTAVNIKLPIKQITDFIPEESGSEISFFVNNNIYSKILIFEDDISLGNMIHEFLTQKGFKVKLCSNTRDIKGFIRVISTFDIVFTDMQMLNITGTDILSDIRELDPEIPVWLMTANDEYSEEKALYEGFSGLIKKPVKMSRLLKILSGEQNSGKPNSGEPNKGKMRNNKAETSDPSDNWNGRSLEKRFPGLVSMFYSDTEYIKDLLSLFVQSSSVDTDNLYQAIDKGDFREAQKICHKIHPFLSQLDADHICVNLRKMDGLRDRDESAYPNWKTELSESVRMIREFTENIKKDYL
ncbi:MAG: hybrid sensor histidine kinase/response regulator [Fermentimonas sp.]|nr:hybrid sensor histidine kinase/response regulator [Fermentimonas sp.]